MNVKQILCHSFLGIEGMTKYLIFFPAARMQVQIHVMIFFVLMLIFHEASLNLLSQESFLGLYSFLLQVPGSSVNTVN